MATKKTTKTTHKKTTHKRAPRLPFLPPLTDDEKASADRWARDDEEHLKERSENREFRRKVRELALTFIENIPHLLDAYAQLMPPRPHADVDMSEMRTKTAQLKGDIERLRDDVQGVEGGVLRLESVTALHTHDIGMIKKTLVDALGSINNIKNNIVELSDDDVAAIRMLTTKREGWTFPAVVPGGSSLAGPWAQLTLAVGDINANGKVDVSVTGEMAGRTFPRLVVDLDLGQAFSLFAGVKDAIGRAIENVTKGGR